MSLIKSLQCETCGQNVEKSDNFCRNCGTKLNYSQVQTTFEQWAVFFPWHDAWASSGGGFDTALEAAQWAYGYYFLDPTIEDLTKKQVFVCKVTEKSQREGGVMIYSKQKIKPFFPIGSDPKGYELGPDEGPDFMETTNLEGGFRG